jgi:hypothetical protein
MTDQPTKGPFIAVPFNDLIWVTKKENSHLNLQEVSNLRHILAAFHGPDREANAALFLRAQHMDELVDAVRQAAVWFRDYAAVHRIKGDADKAKRNSDRADFLGAVFAKIQEDK